jgi:hypothetical protein
MAATLTIRVSKDGVESPIRTGADNVAEALEASDLIRATALPVRLLDGAVREFFSKGAAVDDEVIEVLVPTDRDGELDCERKIRLQVGVLPRDAFDGVPDWFVAGVKQLFPQGEGPGKTDWADAEAAIPKDVLLAYHTEEYVEKHKHLSEEDLNLLHDAPYCSRTEEKAVSLFHSHVNGFSRNEKLLDHWGFIGELDDTVLVSEPYAVDQAGLQKLVAMCNQLEWEFKIKGISGHCPGSTLRIEIKPRRGSQR